MSTKPITVTRAQSGFLFFRGDRTVRNIYIYSCVCTLWNEYIIYILRCMFVTVYIIIMYVCTCMYMYVYVIMYVCMYVCM